MQRERTIFQERYERAKDIPLSFTGLDAREDTKRRNFPAGLSAPNLAKLVSTKTTPVTAPGTKLLDLPAELLQGITSKLNLYDRWNLSFATRRLRGIAHSEPPVEINLPLFHYTTPLDGSTTYLTCAPILDPEMVKQQQTAAKSFLKHYSNGRPLLSLRCKIADFNWVGGKSLPPNLLIAEESFNLMQKFLSETPGLQKLQVDALLNRRHGIEFNENLAKLSKLQVLSIQHGNWTLDSPSIQHLTIQCAFDFFLCRRGIRWQMEIGNLPRLETLTIEFQQGQYARYFDDYRLLDFQTLPELRSISLECGTLYPEHQWEGESTAVTDLYLGEINVHQPNRWFSNISSTLQRLFLWKFQEVQEPFLTWPQPCTIEFPNLQVLELWHCRPSFIQTARFPRLRHCSITAFTYDEFQARHNYNPFAAIVGHAGQLETIFLKVEYTSAQRAETHLDDPYTKDLVPLIQRVKGESLKTLFVDGVMVFEDPKILCDIFDTDNYRYLSFNPDVVEYADQRAETLRKLDTSTIFEETKRSQKMATNYRTVNDMWKSSWHPRLWWRNTLPLSPMDLIR